MNFDFSQKPGQTVFIREIIKNEKPLVSVITPYYNAGRFFKELYPCVLNQTFPWFEWIIVDDGSTKQEDLELLSYVENLDSRIQVVHKENGGISSARNYGIHRSNTDIIITLDADELIEPTYFEVLYWALYYNPEASWAYTDSVGFQNQEYVWQYPFDAEKLKTYNFLVESAAIRKAALLEVGCYDEVEKHYFEDWRVWLKLLSKSKFPVHISSLEFWYRRTDGGVLNKINTDDTIKKRADKLISEVAETADGSVKAKTFEGYMQKDSFFLPRRSSFTKSYFTCKEKIQILFIIPWMTAGGADQFNLDFIRLLDKNKYEIIVVSTVPSDNIWKQKFRKYISQIYSLPEFLDVENYAEFISYIIETRKIDICMISNSYYGYYLLPWLKINYPEVAMIDYVHMEEMYWRDGGYARTSMAMADILEKTYVCNGATQKVFCDLFKRNPEKVETLYIGVDYDKYDPEKITYGEVRKKYSIPLNGKIVLFPCRLHGQKRPHLMIEIARRVIAEDPSIYFLVVGDGDERWSMEQKVEEYKLKKHIIFTGMQNDMRPFYKDSNLTLICSLREGLSLTAYESCSMMTPVISADVGGQSELIDDSVGKVLPLLQNEKDIHVKVYSEQEIQQYVLAILHIFSDKMNYEIMCKNCREKIVKSFGLDTMIQHMEEAINECFTEPRIVSRKAIADTICQYPYLSADVLSMYLAYESMVQENDRVWKEKCEFERAKIDLERQLEEARIESGEIWKSWSFKIGRGITWIPRKIRGGIRCISEHGLLYTVKYVLKKLV